MILFSTFLIASISTILLMPILIHLACKINLVDFPNERKVHCNPIPRTGGIAMALAAFLPIFVWTPMNPFVKSVLIGAGIIVIFGFIDDMQNIGIKKKFAGQIFSACIVILYGGLKIKTFGLTTESHVILPDWLSVPLTISAIVAVTNAINLSDGLDGLAGGITLLTFLCIGYLSFLSGFQDLEVMSVAMVGAIFGLLRYNTHPAIVFMGDAGSQLLGFFAIVLSLTLTQRNIHLSPILPVLIIGLPIFDTLSVIVQRIVSGRSPFVADKNHLHHKLMNFGFHHSESVVLIYVIHAILVCLAFILRYQTDWILLSVYGMIVGAVLTAIFIAERRGWKFKRYPVVDAMIKRALQKFKKENIIIKVSFKVVEVGFIFLLIFTCFLPHHIHIYFSIASMVMLGLIVFTWRIKKKWTLNIIELSIFFMIPFLVYFSEKDVFYLIDTFIRKAYSYSYGILILFVLLTLKFTRRSGFKSTPMDFLILIIALVVPNLPDERIRDWQMGFVAAKIIVLFFTYEILKGELRLNTRSLGLAGIAALLIISIRGFLG